MIDLQLSSVDDLHRSRALYKTVELRLTVLLCAEMPDFGRASPACTKAAKGWTRHLTPAG
jgi:hypothetical protein